MRRQRTMEVQNLYIQIVMVSALSYISYGTAYSISYIDTIDGGFGEDDYINLLHRLRREAVDPDVTPEPPTSDYPNPDSGHYDASSSQGETSNFDPSGFYGTHDTGSYQGDTGNYDPSGSQGDGGNYDPSSSQGDTASFDPSGYHGDAGSSHPSSFYDAASSHGDTYDRMNHGDTGYPNTDGSTRYNPLHMTRPGEPPPMALPMTHDPDQPIPLPLTHEYYPSEASPMTPTESQNDPSGGDPIDPQGTDSTVKDTVQPQALAMTGENLDTPVAMAQRRGRGQVPKPSSTTPNRDSGPQGQGRGQGQSPPRAAPEWPTRRQGGPRDTGPRVTGPRDTGPRDTGFRDMGPPRTGDPFTSSGSRGSDLLATAAILNSDVHDTVADGMEMIARTRAIESLTRGGGHDRPLNHDRPPPEWGHSRDSTAGSAPRRTGSGQGDMLDTITKMHVMKNQADIVQDHVDTVGDIHRDSYDYRRRYDFYDPYYRRDYPYDRHRDQNLNRNQSRFPTDQNFDSQTSPRERGYRPPYSGYGPPYDRYPPPRNWGGDGGDYEGFRPGYSIDINTGLPCTNMSDPKCQMSMGGEMQIETPYGEMDMEPGELELEGPGASELLKMLRINTGTVHPLHQEITLNHAVLGALQRRFGVNTTQGIRRMSSNPDFQAFMYRVLTHSTPIVPGEYFANLTKTEVDTLMVNLDGSRRRLQTTNLDHAKLNYQNTTQDGTVKINDGTKTDVVLTIDGGPVPNTGRILDRKYWAPLSPMGGPGMLSNAALALPLAQGQTGEPGTEAAQSGTVAALVSHMLRGEGAAGGEPAEATEGKSLGTNNTQPGSVAGEGEPRENEQGEAKTPTNQQNISGTATPNTTTTGSSLSNSTDTNTVVPVPNGTNTMAVVAPPGNAVTNTQDQLVTNAKEGHVSTSQGVPGSSSNGAVSPNSLEPQGTKTQATGAGAHAKETDIVGKDANKGLSKDARTKANTWEQGTVSNQGGTGTAAGAAAGASAGTAAGTSAGTAAGTSAGTAAGTAAGTGFNGVNGVNGAGTQPASDGTVPIGLSEAGLAPGATGQGLSPDPPPTKVKQSGYSASTAFAIAAVILIACAIILGPIVCMLCKAREKAVERKRKRNALKNRDVAGNNIMEAMMLHEFGPEAPNFVSNEAAAAMEAYKTEAYYSPLKSDMTELAKLNQGPGGRAGCLP